MQLWKYLDSGRSCSNPAFKRGCSESGPPVSAKGESPTWIPPETKRINLKSAIASLQVTHANKAAPALVTGEKM